MLADEDRIHVVTFFHGFEDDGDIGASFGHFGLTGDGEDFDPFVADDSQYYLIAVGFVTQVIGDREGQFMPRGVIGQAGDEFCRGGIVIDGCLALSDTIGIGIYQGDHGFEQGQVEPGLVGIVAGGDDGIVRGWSVSPDDAPDPIFDHPAEVLNIKFSPDGRVLAVGMKYGVVRFWDVSSSKELFTTPAKREELGELRHHHSYSFDFVAFSPDSRFAAIIGPSHTVSVWNIGQREVLQSFTPEKHKTKY